MTRRFTGPIGKSVKPWGDGAPLIARGRVLLQQCLDKIERGGLKQFVAQERWPDGSTIRALAMRHSSGAPLLRVWIERPQPTSKSVEKLPGLLIEHGFLLFDTSSVHLNAALAEWYESLGDPVCPVGTDHHYGQLATTIFPGACPQWPDPLPNEGAETLVTARRNGGGPSSLLELQVQYDRDPAAYSGLARLVAQSMQGFRDIVEALASPWLEDVDPRFDGVIRDRVEPTGKPGDPDYDPGRLRYWRVKIASEGVAMVQLTWPEEMGAFAEAVRTGEVNEEPLTADQLQRYETVLVQTLKLYLEVPEGAPSGTPPTAPAPILVVNAQRHSELIGGAGFSFLDGWPFFSSQMLPFGGVNQHRCVLTDIRTRFDMGGEVATTLEYVFAFDALGAPLCEVSQLYQHKWAVNNGNAYFYRGIEKQGRVYLETLCRAFGNSFPHAEADDAVLAAWYNSDGVLQTIKQYVPIEENTGRSVNPQEAYITDDGRIASIGVNPAGNIYYGRSCGSGRWRSIERWDKREYSRNRWDVGENSYVCEYLLIEDYAKHEISVGVGGQHSRGETATDVETNRRTAVNPLSTFNYLWDNPWVEQTAYICDELYGEDTTYYPIYEWYQTLSNKDRRGIVGTKTYLATGARTRLYGQYSLASAQGRVYRLGRSRDAVLYVEKSITSVNEGGVRGVWTNQGYSVIAGELDIGYQSYDNETDTWGPLTKDKSPIALYEFGYTNQTDLVITPNDAGALYYGGFDGTPVPDSASHVRANNPWYKPGIDFFNLAVEAEQPSETTETGFAELVGTGIVIDDEEWSTIWDALQTPTPLAPCLGDVIGINVKVSALGELVYLSASGEVGASGSYSIDSSVGRFVGWA